MPKVRNTRKQRAAELLERVKRGPCFSSPVDGMLTTLEAEKYYRMWSASWILNDLIDLVPELRKAD